MDQPRHDLRPQIIAVTSVFYDASVTRSRIYQYEFQIHISFVKKRKDI